MINKLSTLHRILKRKGISYTWIALEMKINKVTLSNKLSGKALLTEKDKQKIADILYLPIDTIFKD